jgi:peptidoglycan/xylan/chitin deacetylase (PgdA/CDA1 family)
VYRTVKSLHPAASQVKSTCKPKNIPRLIINTGTIALAFDDGPAKNFTSKVLDLLKSYDMKATFFVTGHDFAQPIDDPTAEYGAVLNRMHSEGHQIGHHTWTHENLTTLNDTRVTNQMLYNEMALRNVLGFIPTYMRPPYLSCKGNCPDIVGNLGYHIITANLDTKGTYYLPASRKSSF